MNVRGAGRYWRWTAVFAVLAIALFGVTVATGTSFDSTVEDLVPEPDAGDGSSEPLPPDSGSEPEATLALVTGSLSAASAFAGALTALIGLVALFRKPKVAPTPGVDPVQQLERLAALHQAGAISNQEYQRMKADVARRL